MFARTLAVFRGVTAFSLLVKKSSKNKPLQGLTLEKRMKTIAAQYKKLDSKTKAALAAEATKINNAARAVRAQKSAAVAAATLKANAYNRFTKVHFKKVGGSSFKAKSKAVAALWKKQQKK
jgi:hypothetical protein